ncbi:hypothetical protein K503DRAFT_778157 [Rhizopogon vinicolor AM-OR11-026]|uniref:Uncharacterized protein n=1 Tax=Rhizopogon vinicolor AM-OR11-026 TaxID=1314800 RepID=A0A1B7MCZ9_9AGAM|nr:hypothetical protein K503DRAFT_778157 [Rhizopogon vinicolor AM-OR11-026]
MCFPTLNPELSHQLILHHHTQIMRFCFFVIITALTTSMPVSACKVYDDTCYSNSDCCSNGCLQVNTPSGRVGYCQGA